MRAGQHRPPSPRSSSSSSLHDGDSDLLDAEPSPPQPSRGFARRIRSDTRAKERSASRTRPRSDHRQLKADPAEKTRTAHSDEELDADGHVIQVAIRCRPRKRRRHERRTASHAGIRRSRDWLSRTKREGSDDDGSSSSSSDTDFSSAGVLEFSSQHHQRTGRRSHYSSKQEQQKPSLFVQTQGGEKRRLEFDFIFPPSARQRDVYDGSVRQQIAHVLRAHELSRPPTHATIVAYGQTGTGKTYTMGMLTSVHDEAERGIIPRAIAQVMEYVESYNSRLLEGANEYLVVSMSYLQIYLETIQDLLVFPVDGGSSSNSQHPSSTTPHGHQQQRRRRPNSSDLQVRQRQNQAFYVEGLSEYEVSSIDDVHVLLETATRNRVLASTARNKTSSRSHTLLTISLKRSARRSRRRRAASSDFSDSNTSSDEASEGDDEEIGTDAHSISFVDLAGSERVDGAFHFLNSTRRRQELRIREAKFINRSLSALGSVIAALAQPRKHRGVKTSASLAATLAHIKRNGKSPSSQRYHQQHQQEQLAAQPPRHIRFRDSQLTKLLQSRLISGRGQLLLIATIDDQRANLAETLSTLKFASQCRRVELRSPRSSAAKRKDSLLEQVFEEMKATYEAREAVLRKEYQSRIEALEAQLNTIKSDTNSQRHAAQLSAYMALCALADQTPPASDERKTSGHRRHPEMTSFGSETEVAAYVTALQSRIQTTLQTSGLRSEPARADASSSQHVHGRSENTEKTPQARQLSPPIAPLVAPLKPNGSPALAELSDASEVADARTTDVPVTSAACCPTSHLVHSKTRTKHRTPAPAQLSPAYEDAFKSVARLLLSSPELLAAYDVAPDVDVDISFSQIDASQ